MIRYLLIKIVQAYRFFLSPWLGNHCRFHPTCSDYCLQCLRHFSPWTALWLTLKRVGRCHPWSAGGVDPIPNETR
ncbi:MAG: membrane protein insertion efficiency factor YidD [Gammaproteobacteria bacterium]